MNSSNRPVQHFSKEYIERCSKLTSEQLLEFAERARQLYFDSTDDSPTILISMKIKENLLQVFKQKCEFEGKKYQTQIKVLMREYLSRF